MNRVPHGDSRLESAGPPRAIVARALSEVEALRPAWEAADISDIDAHIDCFLTVVRSSPDVVRPHVVYVPRNGEPDLFGIARLERIHMPIALGYRTVARPVVTAVVVAFGGIVGTRGPLDEQLVVEQLRRPLDDGEADVLMLRKIDASGSLPGVVCDGVGWVRRSHAHSTTRRWTATVPESLDAFMAGRSAKTRQTLRRQDRKLERDYSERLRVRRFGSIDEMSELCRDLEAVASTTYQRGLGAAYSGNALELALIEAGLRFGWFRAWILYIDDRPVAFWAGTTHAGTFATGTPGFDPEFTRDSVGRYTMFRMVEDLCADERVHRLDFGHGEADYKAAFGAATLTETDVFVARRALRPIGVNLAVSTAAGINALARRVVRDSAIGRRLKRGWRRRIAASKSGPE